MSFTFFKMKLQCLHHSTQLKLFAVIGLSIYGSTDSKMHSKAGFRVGCRAKPQYLFFYLEGCFLSLSSSTRVKRLFLAAQICTSEVRRGPPQRQRPQSRPSADEWWPTRFTNVTDYTFRGAARRGVGIGSSHRSVGCVRRSETRRAVHFPMVPHMTQYVKLGLKMNTI